ncbi:hypothetical protein F0P96_13415 [Hymenobacter busanensis]|uniref:Uncharacterized protein n=1 Tax=Hymenobacter busanensis TaxID=2607656 RepID=A0A7L4ZVH3_9BACT|nr:hypothetical protein [Hymenobacter busanensis]KAA9332464.1 hypothetical protein F0P96_13415 [Hymenobacter busanensis]QHJ07198.1 hypothetical protein GUY19_07855 [Hymenobacter busanensis]
MIFLSALLVAPLLCADPVTDRVFKPELLPAKAARPMAFVPAGWMLERQAAGDLNADKRPDQVLLLVERPSAAPDAKRERAVVVLLAEPTGQFRRVGAAGAVLPCVGCDETAAGTDGVPELAISKGQVSLRHIAGNAQTTDRTLRFRYESTADRVRLVGEDHIRSSRQVLDTTVRHTDFLTGQQQTERIYADPKAQGSTRQLTSRSTATVPTAPRYLEDLNLNTLL